MNDERRPGYRERLRLRQQRRQEARRRVSIYAGEGAVAGGVIGFIFGTSLIDSNVQLALLAYFGAPTLGAIIGAAIGLVRR